MEILASWPTKKTSKFVDLKLDVSLPQLFIKKVNKVLELLTKVDKTPPYPQLLQTTLFYRLTSLTLLTNQKLSGADTSLVYCGKDLS